MSAVVPAVSRTASYQKVGTPSGKLIAAADRKNMIGPQHLMIGPIGWGKLLSVSETAKAPG